MKSSNFIKIASFLLLLVGFLPLTAQKKPNVLFIIVDELSAESMSWQIGNKYLHTPNMDKLAKNGVRFTNAYCANPLCTPSRSSMFTGKYPHELGIQANNEKDERRIDPVKFPTLGSMFKTAGYETGYIGKWHLPYDREGDPTHGFSYIANKRGNGTDSLLPQYAADYFKAKRKNPFFLVVSFLNPHNICQWARGQKLPDGAIGNPPPAEQCPPLRANALPSKNETDIMQLMRTSFQANDMFPVGKFSDEKWRQYIWAYYRLIEKVDKEIGKVLDALNESGLEDNTLIVFTSDHGDCQGAHRWNQKSVFYEEAAKVPFIINFKGLKPRESDYLVQTGIDLLPSLCDLTGLPMPAQTNGISLKQLMTTGTTPAERDYLVVSDHLIQGAVVDGQKPEPEGRMLRNKQFKYWIYNEGKQRETLYDIKNDPGEMVNVASDPKYKAELEKCRKQLYKWAVKTNDAYIKFLVK
jgi:choline-sulfatase